jgi:hypothetical protein
MTTDGGSDEPEDDDEDSAEETGSAASAIPEKSWTDFLENSAPSSVAWIAEAVDIAGSQYWRFRTPDLRMPCSSDDCSGGPRNFIHVTGDTGIREGAWSSHVFQYACRNCRRMMKWFGFAARLDAENPGRVMVIKLGEFPPFGTGTPERVMKLLGRDGALFRKGHRAEKLGFGLGAFAYYRRVVENRWARILGRMVKVAERLGALPEHLEVLRAAQREQQFAKAVDMMNPAIPPSLRIDGHNPLKLLHDALSDGLHSQDDAFCLDLAHNIRIVLTDLSERIAFALQKKEELTESVTRLLRAHADKVARKKAETGE